MTDQKCRVIKLESPGPFLMPQIFRFGRADDQPETALVWVRGDSPEGVPLIMRLSHQACVSFLQFEKADISRLANALDVEPVALPPRVKECVFPLLSDYTGILSVDETGYIVEFSSECSDLRILISMSSKAYKDFLYRLKKLFPNRIRRIRRSLR